VHVQVDSLFMDISMGNDFLGLCDEKVIYICSNFEQLQSYFPLKLRIKVLFNGY